MKVAKSPAPTPVRVAITPTLMAVDGAVWVDGELEGGVACTAGPGLLPEQEVRAAPIRNTAATATPTDRRDAVRTGPDAPVAGSFTCIPLMVPSERAPWVRVTRPPIRVRVG